MEGLNNKIMRDFYKVLAARDAKMVQYLLAPDIDWWFHGPAAHKYNLMQVLAGICEFDLNDSYKPLVVASRRGGSSNSSYKKDDYNRRYDGDDSKDIMQTSSALENLHLDRKTRNLTNSWRHGGDGSSEEDGRASMSIVVHMFFDLVKEQDGKPKDVNYEKYIKLFCFNGDHVGIEYDAECTDVIKEHILD
ncbi:senescence-associated protein 20 [Tanacetum coccineum]